MSQTCSHDTLNAFARCFQTRTRRRTRSHAHQTHSHVTANAFARGLRKRSPGACSKPAAHVRSLYRSDVRAKGLACESLYCCPKSLFSHLVRFQLQKFLQRNCTIDPVHVAAQTIKVKIINARRACAQRGLL